MRLQDITTVRIHPAIGIARIGNSPEFFYGPEIPGVHPVTDDGRFKDADRQIRRQAARFRCFGYNKAGDEWLELTAGLPKVEIQWTVHLMNRKAAALRFVGDSPRNHRMHRDSLIIDPGPRTLRVPGETQVLDGGRFALNPVGGSWLPGVEVPLGEVRIEPEGRLRVTGSSRMGNPFVRERFLSAGERR